MSGNDIFDINEKPVPLKSWPDDETDVREGIEQPVRKLSLERGTADFELGERERQNRKDKERLLLDLLECMDGFKRVFEKAERMSDASTPNMKSLVNSFQLVRMQLENVLSVQKVSKIEDSSTAFDPEKHDVSVTVEDHNHPDGHILDVEYDGYTWKEKTLRKPKVRVVRNYATDFVSYDVERKAEQGDS